MSKKDPSQKGSQIPRRLQEWLKSTGVRSGNSLRRFGGAVKRRVSETSRGFRNGGFDLKSLDLKNLNEHRGWFQWAFLVMMVFLASEVTSRIIGIFIRPVYPTIPHKGAAISRMAAPAEDYESISRRNMFNVEGKIPDPFDQGLLDCLSQAHPSTQRIQLLGTIVMTDDTHSVALVQDEAGLKLAVRKEELFFDGKFQAMKVERKKLCFQVRSTQDLEYIEIPEENAGLVTSTLQSSGEGITPVSENQFAVKKGFLDEKLTNLNEILQTARAVPYIDGGKFKGFLVQSVDPGLPFAQLGIRQADILTGVNDIVLDNMGKGLEAFQRLRQSPKVALEIIRGGQKMTLSYDVTQ